MRGEDDMRKEYNFDKSVKNPYYRKLKRPISIRLDAETIVYFKQLSEETKIPYQNLINSYLSECASKKLRPTLQWTKKGIRSSKIAVAVI
jgi:predicted DNA binding CopG/RHH family protein